MNLQRKIFEKRSVIFCARLNSNKSSAKSENEINAQEKAKILFKQQRKIGGPNGGKSSRVAICFGLIAVGIVCVVLFSFKQRSEAEHRRERRRAVRSFGQGQIGGAWELLNEEGKIQKSTDLLGNYVLLYFGFINCPDICPDEMEKMVKIVDDLSSDKEPFPIIPVFISVDPKRDTPSRIKEYCQRFSKNMRGFTSDSEEKVKEVTKKYRAYYSKAPAPEGSSPDDYLVDHSIIIYLLGPSGEFIEHFGRDKTAEQVVQSIRELTGRTKNWWNLWGRIN